MWMKLLILLQVNVLFCLCHERDHREHVNMIDSGDCSTDSLAIYKIELEGHWSQELFPKHYPLVRPPAHFSKTFGEFDFLID